MLKLKNKTKQSLRIFLFEYFNNKLDKTCRQLPTSYLITPSNDLSCRLSGLNCFLIPTQEQVNTARPELDFLTPRSA